MTHLSQNLDKLIQMISIEQLLGIVKQTNNSNTWLSEKEPKTKQARLRKSYKI